MGFSLSKTKILDLDKQVDLELIPFPHFVLPNFMSHPSSEMLLTWLELDAPWQKTTIEGFYDCYNLNFETIDLPNELSYLRESHFLDSIRVFMEKSFSIELKKDVDVAAHKLVSGYRMGIHSDFGPIGQTHRLLVQLNRGWTTQQGGLLMLFDEESPTEIKDIHRIYLPCHRTGIGFEISQQSFHAVSPVSDGERSTLCFSFYEAHL